VNKVVLIHISTLVRVLLKILLACALHQHFSSMSIMKLKLRADNGRPTLADMKEAIEFTQTTLTITRYVNTHDEMPRGSIFWTPPQPAIYHTLWMWMGSGLSLLSMTAHWRTFQV